MKEKILIGIICGLILVVVAIGSYVYLVPTVEPEKPADIIETNFPENDLPKLLDIDRPNKKVPRIFAIRNYDKTLNPEEINLIESLRYYVLDNKAKGHLLVLPFDVGGRITVTKLQYDDYEEAYVPSTNENAVLIDDLIKPGYGLLLQYDRPSTNPEYQIKVTQGATTATYVIAPGNANDIPQIEFVSEDRE